MFTFEVLVGHEVKGPVDGVGVDEGRQWINEATLLRIRRWVANA
jgi:hypothetical protein